MRRLGGFCVRQLTFNTLSERRKNFESSARLLGFFCIYFNLVLGLIFKIVHKILQIFDPEPLMIYVGRG